MKKNSLDDYDDEIFGPMTEFDAGFIEGVVRGMPFGSRISMMRERNQERQLNSSKYWCGKVLGFVTIVGLYGGLAYVIYDALSK